MTIPGVIYEARGIDHEDERRALSTIFNGDLGDFVARQVKMAMMKIDAKLGGHYHEYRELFGMAEGEAEFILHDLISGEENTYQLTRGTRLLIPPRIAHKALVKHGSILIGCTERPYIDAATNDHKYDF